MQTLIVFIDDVDHAAKQVLPMVSDNVPARVVLAACPPRLTRHAAKWVNKSDRQAWQRQWFTTRTRDLVQMLEKAGQQVMLQVADRPLMAVTKQLQAQWGSCRVLDARRPKWLVDDEPVTPNQPVGKQSQWALPGSLVALGAMAALAAD